MTETKTRWGHTRPLWPERLLFTVLLPFVQQMGAFTGTVKAISWKVVAFNGRQRSFRTCQTYGWWWRASGFISLLCCSFFTGPTLTTRRSESRCVRVRLETPEKPVASWLGLDEDEKESGLIVIAFYKILWFEQVSRAAWTRGGHGAVVCPGLD